MTVTIRHGDCREVLQTLPDQSVHCCVTSPPYFGLRDYGTATWDGGDTDCNHAKISDVVAAIATSTLGGGKKSTGHLQEGFKKECGHCGAIRVDNQIGLEATPDAFVAEMVGVFREVRRVLRDDGTLWLNLGDSYAANYGNGGKGNTGALGSIDKRAAVRAAGLKSKDLLGIPWRVAFALQADGWYLRQDIIWSKPNPMPESVTDRCTKAHEYIFLMSKSARYYYDAGAIKEDSVAPEQAGQARLIRKEAVGVDGTLRRDVGRRPIRTEFRNRRSVWTVTTNPFAEAHFATFPPDLIEPCIKAGCPQGGTVLDPFGGAGTTGLVADRLGRDAILIELNPEYAAMAQHRIEGDAGMFAEVSTLAAGDDVGREQRPA